mmetsp:Transcript_10573/g.31166  ORF Transcript_10573/g.31166 Transcript_10573/m.31166 type:complete len:403 (-) Transcript_10573:92-1300(-)
MLCACYHDRIPRIRVMTLRCDCSCMTLNLARDGSVLKSISIPPPSRSQRLLDGHFGLLPQCLLQLRVIPVRVGRLHDSPYRMIEPPVLQIARVCGLQLQLRQRAVGRRELRHTEQCPDRRVDRSHADFLRHTHLGDVPLEPILHVSTQLRHDDARMARVRRYSGPLHPRREFAREQQVGELGLTVGHAVLVVVVHDAVLRTPQIRTDPSGVRPLLGAGAHGDHAARGALLQLFGEQFGQVKVSDVIDADVTLESVGGDIEAVGQILTDVLRTRRLHDSRVVHQNMEGLFQFQEFVDLRDDRSNGMYLTLPALTSSSSKFASSTMPRTAFYPLTRLRAATMTSAPFRANSNAVRYPTPVLLPVTIVTVPVKSPMSDDIKTGPGEVYFFVQPDVPSLMTIGRAT